MIRRPLEPITARGTGYLAGEETKERRLRRKTSQCGRDHVDRGGVVEEEIWLGAAYSTWAREAHVESDR